MKYLGLGYLWWLFKSMILGAPMSLKAELIIPIIKVKLSLFQAQYPSAIWFVCWWRLSTKGILLMLGCTSSLFMPRSAASPHLPPAPTLRKNHMWSAIQGASKGHQPKQDVALCSQTCQSGGSLPRLSNHSSDQYRAGLYCVRKQPLSAPRQSRLNPPRGPVLDYHVCSAHNHCIMEIRLDWLAGRKKKTCEHLNPADSPELFWKQWLYWSFSSA